MCSVCSQGHSSPPIQRLKIYFSQYIDEFRVSKTLTWSEPRKVVLDTVLEFLVDRGNLRPSEEAALRNKVYEVRPFIKNIREFHLRRII